MDMFDNLIDITQQALDLLKEQKKSRNINWVQGVERNFNQIKTMVNEQAMPTITLNCLVVGENPYEIAFNIKMNLTKAVSELKEAIKTKKQAFRIPASRRPVKAKRTIVIEAMVGVLQLIGKPSYNFKFKLATTTTNITTLGKALSDDSELEGIARRFLRQNEFFENDKAKLYFLRKKRKDEVKICTETTLSMANERLGITNEIAHQNSLDRLKEIAEKESLSDEGDYEEPGDEDKPSKENPRQVFLSKSRVATPKPCYFDGLPIHAGYSLMTEDWIIDGVNLSNNLKGTGLVSKRFHQQVVLDGIRLTHYSLFFSIVRSLQLFGNGMYIADKR
ncbi:hypothetical protein RhiirA4_470500 [Rhizophagus irregularis]|uniref:Crinkler effector protein N-terminal domain-containing protein n=1 Tax=Rhizophagus irregularis TaxID=588596 RepID=A0A2I1H1D0_9GLOM|nr:hypothetical protein RhiirA4_470500 [Rhizophagus irregularis]